MIRPRTHLKNWISLVLVTALASVFSLSSFAAPAPATGADEPVPLPDAAGALTIKGEVTLNGNDTQTGATVLSGSIIATGEDGNALIDLGAQGRVEVRDNTTITLTFTPATVQVHSHCGDIKVKVVSGQVDLRLPKVMTIKAGEEKEFDDTIDFLTNGVTEVAVDCDDDLVAGYIWPGASGIVALLGIAGTIAILIGNKDRRSPRRPPLSPTQL